MTERRQNDVAVAALRAEVGELKTGTAGLATQVESLSEALTAMNTIQLEQRRQREDLSKVKQTVVPRTEFEKEASERTAADRAYRRRVLTRIAAAGSIALAVVAATITVLSVILHNERTKAGQYRDAGYANCLARAEQSRTLGAFLQQQVLIEKQLPSAQSARRIASFEALSRNYPTVSCEGLRR